MEFFDVLMEKFGVNEPIFLSELDFMELSQAGIRMKLKRLVDNGKIERYADGIFYIPEETIFGKSQISAESIIRKKYVNDSNEIYGYYTGLSLLNELQLTTQVPNSFKIVTNRIKSPRLEQKIGGFRVELIKSRVEINAENIAVLKMLDLLNYNQFYLLEYEEKEKVLKKLGVNSSSKKILAEIIGDFPATVSKKLIESEVVYVIAS